jgi:hypothetical protein
MQLAAQYVLPQLVAYAGLIGATIEYIEIVKRRGMRRQLELECLAAREAGLQGMVRVFLAGEEPAEPPLSSRTFPTV